MANSENIIFWSPVPTGSIFKIQAAGDQTSFTIVVGCSRNGASKPVMPFSSLVPGPAQQAVATGERWSFTPVVSIFQSDEDPVTVDAWVEDSAGNKVTLPDDTGAEQPLVASWTFNGVGGNVLKIFVAAA